MPILHLNDPEYCERGWSALGIKVWRAAIRYMNVKSIRRQPWRTGLFLEAAIPRQLADDGREQQCRDERHAPSWQPGLNTQVEHAIHPTDMA